ncbi:hypothetical protein BO70DRAFT_232161 [Aspergillus heteromorphus CBS 117.55]|uniref:Uncharacterized protein n=1 Tax=Aspergillus heteromorphus CBS 117.55 TaxID=1448321 RepID=A0A317WH33_9EURO|nr:uncharacterized protein BO70DRAFT_232161 [Aspergillus heteromorphus CBS 117.55]PWY85001.1 hypothetical protein BO70DRAFT_232161 [Aspergillus heteromorphus CBS 117.55]
MLDWSGRINKQLGLAIRDDMMSFAIVIFSSGLVGGLPWSREILYLDRARQGTRVFLVSIPALTSEDMQIR